MNGPVILTTIEGHEVSMEAEDHAKLAKWPGIDLGRLHVIDDEVYPEVRGKQHFLTLETMLDLMSRPPVVSKTPSLKGCAPGGLLAHFLATGETYIPKGSGSPMPPVKFKGDMVPPRVFLPKDDGAYVLVAVVDEAMEYLGRARVPRIAYRALIASRLRPDPKVWKLGADGRVATRIRRFRDDTYMQAVEDAFGELGLADPGACVFEPGKP